MMMTMKIINDVDSGGGCGGDGDEEGEYESGCDGGDGGGGGEFMVMMMVDMIRGRMREGEEDSGGVMMMGDG